jgi:class 3 adenylate cyclase
MDCRGIEPTTEGFITRLGTALEMQGFEADYRPVIDRLGETGQRTVLALDTYETFGLMDTWLRQVFVPALPENVFTIIAGREAPNAAWSISPGWEGLFREIELRELSADDTRKMLESRGLTSPQIERVESFARGHPLALEMAAAAIRTQPNLEITEGPPPKVLQQLTQAFLAGLPLETMEAVEAATTVRRVTEPLLRALLAVSSAREVFDNVQALPFIDVTAEGLIFHDVVRDTISKDLARRDPERYHTCRRRAWSYFFRESHRAVGRSLWQCTADTLYLIENPVIREAFFPEGATDYRVEPASTSDSADIREIAAAAEPEEAARLIEQWWTRHPDTFSVVKTRDGKLAAFYIIFEPAHVDRELLAEDPLTGAWSLHLSKNPVADGERVLFLRRWLARTTGEAPSPAQGACWLDIKRTYMELRPTLRRLYTTVTDLSTYAPIVIPLGFAPLEEANVALGGVTYNSALLDFGASSVDGWLATLVGAELGVEPTEAEEAKLPEGIVTEHARQLVTILFTDIVSSTERAAELGDRRWRDLLERHHALVRRELARFQGREIDTAGDGFLATFERPAQAIQCASAITDSVRPLGINIRAGLHLGECEMIGEVVRGIAVHIGARVAAIAGTDEVLVSSTVKDAMAGSDIRFEDRGSHILKGIPGEWHLFAAGRGSVP